MKRALHPAFIKKNGGRSVVGVTAHITEPECNTKNTLQDGSRCWAAATNWVVPMSLLQGMCERLQLLVRRRICISHCGDPLTLKGRALFTQNSSECYIY